MAFQTNVFRDGEWVTETIDLEAVLKANTAASRPPRQRLSKPPDCGILTKTVVESPAVHWILPCRLRSETNIDVAFVGDQYVQIFELQKDGRLRPVVRRNDFGSRIRNAQVIGSLPEKFEDRGEISDHHATIDDDDDDVVMDDTGTTGPAPAVQRQRLAPQSLLLVLENSDCIFLSLRVGENGELDFVTSRFLGPSAPLVRLGFHLAVDPSSRYMAISCAEELFVVYELESAATLNRSYARGDSLRYVKSYRPRTVHGVIQKLEFLYPRPADDYHIILLLIVVRNGRSRMVTYEWEAGDDLKSVLSEEKRGYRLPVEHQMPLLLIPLTVRTAFLAISQRSIAVCKDVLQGPPDFENFVLEDHEASEIHHGLDRPLWTAWTRPYRLPNYFHRCDYIYLAREDGLVTGLDIDSENILGATVKIVKSQCNISTAFCSLHDAYNDILVMGSDSGPGAIWQVPPRLMPTLLGALPNWSPAFDLVTTDEFSTWNEAQSSKGNEMVSWRKRPHDSFKVPDRIFAISGIGTNGAVTEYRHGMIANIGLDIDYQAPVRQCWIFPANLNDPSEGFHLLLSLPDRTAVLHLSENLAEASEVDTETVGYDLSSRTIAARQIAKTTIVQVTENALAVVGPGASNDLIPHELINQANATVVDADMLGDLVVVSSHLDTQFYIQLCRVEQGGTLVRLRTYPVAGEVTCIALGRVGIVEYIMAGVWFEGRALLHLYPSGDDPSTGPRVIDVESADLAGEPRGAGEPERRGTKTSTEALVSILSVPGRDPYSTWIYLGTRGGELLNVSIRKIGEESLVSMIGVDKVGLTAATLSRLDSRRLPNSLFVCCDTRVILMTNVDEKSGRFKTKHYLWSMDASDPSSPSPPATSVMVPQPKLFEEGDNLPLVIVAGSRILLAELQHRPGVAQRSFPVHGTPSRLIYSQTLECLVVAVKKDNKPTLVFLDPDTGEDLSCPMTKDGEPVEFVGGLGKAGDKIYGLSEWEYRSGNSVWVFILVGTESGRLITIATKPLPRIPGESRARIQYNMRNMSKEPDGSVFAVAGEGQNLVFCAGTVVHWQTLDSVEKKFKPMKTYQLNSFGTAVRTVGKQLAVLTTGDSLSIVDRVGDGVADSMTVSHEDPVARNTISMIEVGDEVEDASMSLFLVSDREGGITGLWVPWQQPGRSFEVLFRASLPSSVMKFCRGRTRPTWQQARRTPQFGTITSTVDNADALGVCLDGSLRHFTLLNTDIWMLLRLIQNLALTSPALNPFTYEEAEPDDILDLAADRGDAMQIDGDMLQRCLDGRALEELFATDRRYYGKMLELLHKLKGKGDDDPLDLDNRREDEEGRTELHFETVYDILEYYLEPAL